MAGRLQASGITLEGVGADVEGNMIASVKHVILANGPPGSGKDEVGRILHEDRRAHVSKFAKRLKEMTHALYGLMDGVHPRVHDYYEDCKNEPHPDFRGISPRDAYIATSEKHFKKVHGETIFGEMLLEDLIDVEANIIVVTDSGFEPEARVLLRHYGPQAVKMIQIHRPGKNFKGDSRGYVDIPEIETVVLHNDSDIAGLEAKVHDYVHQWVNQVEHGGEEDRAVKAHNPAKQAGTEAT